LNVLVLNHAKPAILLRGCVTILAYQRFVDSGRPCKRVCELNKSQIDREELQDSPGKLNPAIRRNREGQAGSADFNCYSPNVYDSFDFEAAEEGN
jgi:hypothetical protein